MLMSNILMQFARTCAKLAQDLNRTCEVCGVRCAVQGVGARTCEVFMVCCMSHMYMNV